LFSALLPIIAGVKRRTNLLWLYALVSFLFDVLINFVLRKLHLPFFWAGNMYLVAEFILLSLYYRQIIFYQRWWFVATTGFLVACFIATFFVFGDIKVNGIGACVFFFPTITVYTVLSMNKMIKEQKVLFLGKSPEFLADVAFVTFFPGFFFVLLFSTFFINHGHAAMLAVLWLFHDVLNISKNCFLAWSLSIKKNAIG
jgi:hypothetical protein